MSNTAIGFNALNNQVSGDGNIALGIRAGAGVTTASNVICIGADGEDIDGSCYIGNIFGTTSPNGIAVLVNSNGRLGTMTSSKRFQRRHQADGQSQRSALCTQTSGIPL